MLNSVQNIKNIEPNIKSDSKGLHVFFSGNYFQQDTIAIPNNVINIYCVYELDPIASTRDDTFTIQNALFGAVKIIKNAGTSKYKYKGYGICLDEGGTFSKGNINNGRNVLIFGVHESSLHECPLIIFMLWVIFLHKELKIRRCMQKKYTTKILVKQVKNLYSVCIIMVGIVIYLLMVKKN